MTPPSAPPGSTDPRPPDEAQTAFDSAGAPDAERVAIGTRLSRYVVVDALGEGAMGRVVRAYDPKLGREVALKLLRTSDADARARIVREGQAMAQLSHPNIVAVYDVDVHEGVPFIAMEYVVGSTLGDWLTQAQQPRRGWREILEAFLAAGRGLAAAHRAGIVHRDFKPHNVLVGAGDDLSARVRVMDFGLARAVEGRASGSDSGRDTASLSHETLTAAGTVMGTPAYMAPEQHSGETTDARCDQYAFCVALWEGLAGVRPFAAKTLVEDKCALRIRETPAARPFPSHLRRVLLRGLAPQPADRFATMDELLVALARDPFRRRLILTTACVVVLGVAAVVGARWWQREQALRACHDEGALVTQIWNPAAAQDLRIGLEATGSHLADDASMRIGPWLDRYAAQWTTVRADACLVRVESGDDELYHRAVECLDERRAALGALVRGLTDADPSTIGRAVQAAVGLPPLGPCNDAARLNEGALAPDEATRAEVAGLREEISEVSELASLGRLDEAETRAMTIVDRAEALEFAPLAAQAELLVASIESRRGEFAAARVRLEHAYFVATIAGADDIAAVVALSLTAVVGSDLAEEELGLLWGRIGLACLERLGVTDDLRVAGLLHNIGSVRSAQGAQDEAIDYYERALAIRVDALGADHPEVAGSYINLGLVHGILNHGDEARHYLDRSIAIHELAYGPDHEGIANALNSIAGLEFDRGAVAEARSALERAIAIQERRGQAEHPLTGSLLNNLGSVLLEQGDLEAAQASILRALAIDERMLGTDHPRLAYSLSALGAVARVRGHYDEALAHYRRALALEEAALGVDHIELASTLVPLGRTQLAAGDRSGAIQSLERALSIDVAASATPIQQADARFPLALALIAHDRARAIALAQQAEQAYLVNGSADDSTLLEIQAQLHAWLRATR